MEKNAPYRLHEAISTLIRIYKISETASAEGAGKKHLNPPDMQTLLFVGERETCIGGFTSRARFLTDYAVGEFRFHEVPGGTEVQWTYSFHKRSWLMTPVVSWVVQNDFAEFMRSALQAFKEAAEQHYPKT